MPKMPRTIRVFAVNADEVIEGHSILFLGVGGIFAATTLTVEKTAHSCLITDGHTELNKFELFFATQANDMLTPKFLRDVIAGAVSSDRLSHLRYYARIKRRHGVLEMSVFDVRTAPRLTQCTTDAGWCDINPTRQLEQPDTETWHIMNSTFQAIATGDFNELDAVLTKALLQVLVPVIGVESSFYKYGGFVLRLDHESICSERLVIPLGRTTSVSPPPSSIASPPASPTSSGADEHESERDINGENEDESEGESEEQDQNSVEQLVQPQEANGSLPLSSTTHSAVLSVTNTSTVPIRVALPEPAPLTFTTMLQKSETSNSTIAHDRPVHANKSRKRSVSQSDEVAEPLKRPAGYMSGFNLFAKEKRKDFERLYPGTEKNAMNKIVGKAWKCLCQTMRAEYEERAKADKLRYLRELQEYNEAAMAFDASTAATSSSSAETAPPAAKPQVPRINHPIDHETLPPGVKRPKSAYNHFGQLEGQALRLIPELKSKMSSCFSSRWRQIEQEDIVDDAGVSERDLYIQLEQADLRECQEQLRRYNMLHSSGDQVAIEAKVDDDNDDAPEGSENGSDVSV